MIVSRSLWRWLLTTIFIASSALVVCGVLIYLLVQGQNANKQLAMENRQLISKQQSSFELAQRQQYALTQYVLALQGQLKSRGVKPIPAPQSVQTILTVVPTPKPSSNAPATPRPTAKPSPRPKPTSPPSKPPRPSPSPTPTPTSTCAVKLGTLCVKNPLGS